MCHPDDFTNLAHIVILWHFEPTQNCKRCQIFTKEKKMSKNVMDDDLCGKDLELAKIKGDDYYDDDEVASATQTNESLDAPEVFASRETKNVFRLRVTVICILILATAGISCGVYAVTQSAEKAEFDAQLTGNSDKVLRSFEEIFKEKFGALSTLGVSFTSFASGHNLTWPFVTMNDFQQRAASARRVSNALYTQILPIISGANKEEWERYSVENKGWLDEARQYQQEIGLQETLGQQLRPLEPGTEDSTLDFSSGIGDKIYSFDLATFLPVTSTSSPDYYPIWQQSPVTDRDLVNWNLVEFFSFGPYIEVCSATGDLVIGGFDVFPPGNVSSPDAYTSWVSFLLSFAAGESVEYNGDPMTSIYLPVFDSYDDDTRSQVAVINAVINWKSYFSGILPDNGDKMVVVLANNCQGAHSYLINGPEVEYLGPGDYHDVSLDAYASSAQLEDLLDEDINGLTLNQDVCQYNLTVFPSREMYEHYNTSKFALISAGTMADSEFVLMPFPLPLFVRHSYLPDSRSLRHFLLYGGHLFALRLSGRKPSDTRHEPSAEDISNRIILVPSECDKTPYGRKQQSTRQEEVHVGEQANPIVLEQRRRRRTIKGGQTDRRFVPLHDSFIWW
jgi:hypothetical protein